MGAQIHWFPGHMKKALNEVSEKIKLVDIIIELLDARAPFSSINEQLESMTTGKKKLAVLSKPDLADPDLTELWKKKLRESYDELLVLDLTKPSSETLIAKAVNRLAQEKREKQKAKGMKPQPARAMIIGIPNAGKSSLINRLAKRKAAGVQNKPGFTRSEQWIRVNDDFLLLDTPGILPTNYEDKRKALNLALIGSIREEILPNSDLSAALIRYLASNYPDALIGRFGIADLSDPQEVLRSIADVRKLVTSEGQADTDRAEMILLKEFKDGKLGRISLERP